MENLFDQQEPGKAFQHSLNAHPMFYSIGFLIPPQCASHPKLSASLFRKDLDTKIHGNDFILHISILCQNYPSFSV